MSVESSALMLRLYPQAQQNSTRPTLNLCYYCLRKIENRLGLKLAFCLQNSNTHTNSKQILVFQLIHQLNFYLLIHVQRTSSIKKRSAELLPRLQTPTPMGFTKRDPADTPFTCTDLSASSGRCLVNLSSKQQKEQLGVLSYRQSVKTFY